MIRVTPARARVADADELTRRDLAERMVAMLRDIHVRHPALKDLHAGSPHGTRFAHRATEAAKRELYNPAQVDVMRRMRVLLAGSTRSEQS